MARYELRFKTSVSRDLRGIPKLDVLRLIKRAEALRDDPRPKGCEKLAARELYRVRQGVYRIVYSVDDGKLAVEVVKIGHRRGVYQQR